MAGYQVRRDAQVLAMYEFTTQLATLEPPPPELAQVLGAMPGNQEAMDGFARVNAGVTSPAEFFSPEKRRADHVDDSRCALDGALASGKPFAVCDDREREGHDTT